MNTNITYNQVDTSELDAMFGTAGTDVLLTPDNKTDEFTNNSVAKVLDDVTDPVEKEKEKEKDPVKDLKSVPISNEEGIKVLNDVLDVETATPTKEEGEDTEEADKGRPKTDKSGLVEYLKAKIESQEFGVSDSFDATKTTIDDYLKSLPIKDLHELLDTNWKAKEEEIRNQTPQDFYEALPDEAKAVAEYAAKGGTDWKAFYQAMGKVEEVKQLDPTNEDDHAPIVRSYLQATTKLNPGQIEEQIEDWKESGKLDKKAIEFKDPLDKLQEEQRNFYLKQAEDLERQRQELAAYYAGNVNTTLSKGELAGIKLDKKWAKELEYNMVTNVPGPWSGKPVNYLGYGLEKSQFAEPDYDAVMLAAWILNDKETALNAIRQQGANREVEKVVKLIKMDQGIKAGSEALVETKPVRKLNSNKMANSNDLKRR